MSKDCEFMDGVQHITDNLYRVDIGKVFLEKSSDEQDIAEGEISFFNPRSLSETFDYDAAGCSFEEMKALRSSIQEHGLLTSLIARKKENKICLINGHRRLDAIKQLIDDDELCFDPVSKTNKKASELYSTIIVKVFDEVDEIDAYLLAFEEDKTKVKFGAGTEYKFVQYCMEREIHDNEIIKMTGNNQSWLDGVKSLLSRLHDDTEILDALFSNRMNISAAKKLAQFEEPAERMVAFQEASKKAEEEVEQKKHKQEKSIINTRKKIENALAEKIQAKFSGDDDALDAADALIENYRLQEEKQKEALETMEARVTGKNVQAPPSKPSIGKRQPKKDKQSKVAIGDQSIKMSDVVANWIHPLENIRSNDPNVPDILIEYTKELLDSVLDNSTNPEEFLKKWVVVFESKGLVG